MEQVACDRTPSEKGSHCQSTPDWDNLASQLCREGAVSEEGFKSLFESLPQKVSMKNRHSVYMFCNQRWARDLKIVPAKIFGKSDYDFFPPDTAAKHIENDRRIIEGSPTGESFENIFKIPVKDEDGNVLGILSIEEDPCQGDMADSIPDALYSQENPGAEIQLELKEYPSETNPMKEEREGIFSLELTNDHGPCTDEQRQNIYRKILVMTVPQKIRLAVLGNREARGLLIHDANRVVSLAVLGSPKVTGNEILNFAKQKNISEDVILTISRNKYWMKNYHIRLAIVGNPKTPLSEALKYLPYLHKKDLQDLSKNRNVSSFLRAGANQILLKRNN